MFRLAIPPLPRRRLPISQPSWERRLLEAARAEELAAAGRLAAELCEAAGEAAR